MFFYSLEQLGSIHLFLICIVCLTKELTTIDLKRYTVYIYFSIFFLLQSFFILETAVNYTDAASRVPGASKCFVTGFVNSHFQLLD